MFVDRKKDGTEYPEPGDRDSFGGRGAVYCLLLDLKGGHHGKRMDKRD